MAHLRIEEIATLGGYYEETSACMHFMYRGSEFSITLELSEETAPTLTEYQAAAAPIQNPGPGLQQAHRNLLAVLLQPLHLYIKDRSANSALERTMTLQDMLDRPHYRLNVGRYNEVMMYRDVAGPIYHLMPISADELQADDLDHLPRYLPSDIAFVDFDPSRPSLQYEVRLTDDRQAFFKPAENDRGMETVRELHIQGRFRKLEFPSKFRVSSLLGLVITDDGQSLVGLLFRWIEAKPLADIDSIRKAQHLSRWRSQIEAFLVAMHAAGLTWADVNDCNILIEDDEAGGNAWAIDFAGKGCTDYSVQDLKVLQRQDWAEFNQVFDEP